MSEIPKRLIPLSDVETELWTCVLRVNRFLWKKATFEQQNYIQKKLIEYQADLDAILTGLLLENEPKTDTENKQSSASRKRPSGDSPIGD